MTAIELGQAARKERTRITLVIDETPEDEGWQNGTWTRNDVFRVSETTGHGFRFQRCGGGRRVIRKQKSGE